MPIELNKLVLVHRSTCPACVEQMAVLREVNARPFEVIERSDRPDIVVDAVPSWFDTKGNLVARGLQSIDNLRRINRELAGQRGMSRGYPWNSTAPLPRPFGPRDIQAMMNGGVVIGNMGFTSEPSIGRPGILLYNMAGGGQGKRTVRFGKSILEVKPIRNTDRLLNAPRSLQKSHDYIPANSNLMRYYKSPITGMVMGDFQFGKSRKSKAKRKPVRKSQTQAARLRKTKSPVKRKVNRKVKSRK